MACDNKELLYKEHAMLREELNNIKQAQLWFINFSVGSAGAMGVLFSIGVKEHSPIPVSIACLIPLTILLPSWHLFFDKAVTLTRIVGYLKVLEKIIVRPDLVKNFPGWENALVIFRARQELLQQKETADKSSKENRRFSELRRTSERYWWTCYVIFCTLSWLCILLSVHNFLKLFRPEDL